jgi:hypothetical protein
MLRCARCMMHLRATHHIIDVYHHK